MADTSGTMPSMPSMSDDEQSSDPTGPPWRTPSLPPLCGFKSACEILGVGRMTLARWMQPDSGSFGSEQTRMVPPARIDSGPCWVRADVERFKVEYGRQRAAASDSK